MGAYSGMKKFGGSWSKVLLLWKAKRFEKGIKFEMRHFFNNKRDCFFISVFFFYSFQLTKKEEGPEAGFSLPAFSSAIFPVKRRLLLWESCSSEVYSQTFIDA